MKKHHMHKQGRGYWRTYDGADGLADNWVWSIYQDRDDCLWFGTECGVSRFDGMSFTTFTTRNGLAHNSVSSIFQDRDGNFWFGTRRGGVSLFDGASWVNYSTADGLVSNSVNTIVQDAEGDLWFGTPDGVSRYRDGRFETSIEERGLSNNLFSSLLLDSQGNLWFGTRSGVRRFDGDSWATPEDSLIHDAVSSIVEGVDQKIWFGTSCDIFWRDGECWGTTSVDNPFKRQRFALMLCDREGRLWARSSGRGGGAKSFDGQRWETLTAEDGLANETVFCCLQDREGHLWFGTGGGGVSRYSGPVLTTYTTEQNLAHNDLQAIRQDQQGHYWFATRRGVSRFDGRAWTTFTKRDGLPDSCVYAIEEDREHNLWFGTRNGVARYDGRDWKFFTVEDGLIHHWVWDVLQDREGRFWFATHHGVSCLDGDTWRNFHVADGLPHHDVRTVIQDRTGALWFGTFEGGVCRYDGRTWKTFDADDVLPHNSIAKIYQDRAGLLWFGTRGGGVTCYDGSSWKTFTTQNGLAHDVVVSICEDRAGHLWFGTFGGVSRFDGQIFQRLTDEDGLSSNGVWAIYEDWEGDYWFGTANGLTHFSPGDSTAPTVIVDAIVADQRYRPEDDLVIPDVGGMVAFEFHGMSFKTRPEGMIYRYRLSGHNGDWQTTRERRVEFQNLSVGSYTFEIQAIDRDLSYSQPAQIAMTVKPDPHLEGLMEVLSGGETSRKFIGQSESLRRVQAQFTEVAKTDVTILILGETGTGKGLAAQTIHALSNRKNGPFIQINCGAIPEGLVESELFGHERGAFTGAVTRKLGKVELAAGGTLFLDEIGDLAPEAQVKLLRLLEERQFDRVGGSKTLKTDVRVVAATNRDLRQMVADGQFREDLYFRLFAFPVQVPPLRERREDIPLLASYFLVEMATHLRKKVTHLTSEAQAALMAYDWPGNVRELEHAIQRAVIVCKEDVIRASDIALEFRGGPIPTEEKTITLEECERRYIRQTLEKTNWVVGGANGAAALLDINASTLRSRIRKLGIRRDV